jgi:hypothetical protein
VGPSALTGPLAVSAAQNAPAVPRYDVFELTLAHDGNYANPFFDAGVAVDFIAPSGKVWHIGGFHYGSTDKPQITRTDEKTPPAYALTKANLWKARFAPNETGTWTYRWLFADKSKAGAAGEGSFTCVAGKNPLSGFMRQNPHNPHRWITDDGKPYFPNGTQECASDHAGVGSLLASMSMEGPFRTEGKNLATLPEGPEFVRGPRAAPVNGDFYLRQYARAGFNMFRYSQENCSISLYKDLSNYFAYEAMMTDELLQATRKYGFKMFYGFFGYHEVYNFDAGSPEAMALVQHFIRYSVNRWGAYVDIWELLNEQFASDEWYAIMAPYVKSVCPYGHPVTTSWERPELKDIDIIAPHWYTLTETTPEQADSEVAYFANNPQKKRKEHGKPIILGEAGNMMDKKKPAPPGFGGLWDPTSALRMRIRNWTFFFNEIAYVFWTTNYAKDGHYMNIWLGPEERCYTRALQDFVDRLDNNIKMDTVQTSAPDAVRAYGLKSDKRAAVYLHHYKTHQEPIAGLNVTLIVPAKAKGYWYDPATAAVLGTIKLKPGKQILPAPAFTIDLALLVTPDNAPDIDKDGLANNEDPDDDNDGVADATDTFPLEPEEWADADKDRIGDNIDTDDNADGKADDSDNDGMTDDNETDADNDQVLDSKAVPWDAFPRDPREWQDSDGDGMGDNADPDDDNDGYSDEKEKKAGTNPQNRLSFPL